MYALSGILPLPPLGVLFSLQKRYKRVNYWSYCCQSSRFNIKHPTPRKSGGNVFSAHAMNAYRRNSGTAPLILALRTTWEVWSGSRTGRFIPEQSCWAPMGVLQSGHGVLNMRKFSFPYRKSNPRSSSPSPNHYTVYPYSTASSSVNVRRLLDKVRLCQYTEGLGLTSHNQS